MAIYCGPKEKLSDHIVEQLRAANASRKDKGFHWYVEKVAGILQLEDKKSLTVTEKEKLFFGGFLTGEGSINVSAKKDKGAKFGIVLDPEFSVTQHVNGVLLFLTALRIFGTGSLRYKSGSSATIVYTIDNRESLTEKVVPFYERYCSPFWDEASEHRLTNFKKLLQLFSEKAHTNLSDLSLKMLPLWAEMRKQATQTNASFASLEEAQRYAKNFKKEQTQGSSETTRDLV